MSAPRVALDTNVIISGVIFPHGSSREILLAWRRGRFVLLTSAAQRLELLDVLSRPKIAVDYRVTPADVARLTRRLDRSAVLISPTAPTVIQLRDPDDEAILAIAVEGNADFLVTGDKDLLTCASDSRLGRLAILTPRAFLVELGGAE